MQRLLVGLLWLCLSTGAWARGGGGCLEKGTLVALPGDLAAQPIERLRPGDWVETYAGGARHQSPVLAVVRVDPDSFIKLTTADGHTLSVTAEHPIAIAPGTFLVAARLRPGQPLLFGDYVQRVEAQRAEHPAYNLLVGGDGTYFASGVLVHNKGCFLPDTPVRLSDGREKAISEVRPGERVLAFNANGGFVAAEVLEILRHEVTQYFVVRTAKTELRVTAEHPFYVGAGTFMTLERLREGDWIYAVEGARFEPQQILSVEKLNEPVTVYNLQTAAPHTYFAHGIAVHNKGGGGGGGHSSFRSSGGSRGGANDGPVPWVMIAIFIFVFIVIVSKGKTAELDFLYSRGQVENKSRKTLRLLEFIARTDTDFTPDTLALVARETFTQLQTCWRARDYSPMKSLVLPDLYQVHSSQLEGLRRNHEINVLEGLEIEKVDLVNVRYAIAEHQREFTALISARARDHYVDDRTGKFLRGDESPARFQEFWTFQRSQKGWRLREIEQTRESNALKDENFFEPFTENGVRQVYGAAADDESSAGPAVTDAVLRKTDRVERLLQFLYQTDHIWERGAMVRRVRETFLEVMLALEAGDASKLPRQWLSSQVIRHFEQVIEGRRLRDETVEYRNLCVRTVDLILVRNFNDRALDEYTARVSAHAQERHLRAGQVVSEQTDVTAFETYWTFGRIPPEFNSWHLREVLPPAQGSIQLSKENVDEGSSQQQLEWFYSKKRVT